MSQHRIDFSHRFSTDGLLTPDDLLDTICLMCDRADGMVAVISMLCSPQIIAALSAVESLPPASMIMSSYFDACCCT